MGLKRYQIFLSYAAAFVAVWQYCLKSLNDENDEAKSSFSERSKILIRFAPIWAVLLLGLYALVTIIYNVLTFSDCPEAEIELKQQIEEARADMKPRGIIK